MLPHINSERVWCHYWLLHLLSMGGEFFPLAKRDWFPDKKQSIQCVTPLMGLTMDVLKTTGYCFQRGTPVIPMKDSLTPFTHEWDKMIWTFVPYGLSKRYENKGIKFWLYKSQLLEKTYFLFYSQSSNDCVWGNMLLVPVSAMWRSQERQYRVWPLCQNCFTAWRCSWSLGSDEQYIL